MTNLSQAGGPGRPQPPALAMFQPEIAPNVAAAIRLAACLAVPLHLIEPLGFVLDPRRLRRVAMDYAAEASLHRHASFEAFEAWRQGAGRRLILMSTTGRSSHLELAYRPGDLLLAGSESTGVPAAVKARATHVVRVPLAARTRSLNVVTASAIVLAEALRQLDAFPAPP